MKLGLASKPITSSTTKMGLSESVNEKIVFWKRCIAIARDHPELCAEDVEFNAVLTEMGLIPK